MREVDNIILKLKQNLPSLKEQYKIAALGIFGSYMREEQTENSDVDILVEFEEVPSLLEFMALEEKLHEILNKKVDLVMKSALKPKIGYRILAEVQYV